MPKLASLLCLTLLLSRLSLPAQDAPASMPDASPLQPRADGQPLKIAFAGDSITYGSLVDPSSESFPIVVGKFLGPKFKSASFGAVGHTVQKGDYSYVGSQPCKDAIAFAPDVVVIMLGTNDSKGGAVKDDGTWESAQEFTDDYLSLIAMFQALPSKPRVWLMTPMDAYGEKAYNIRGTVIHNLVVPLVKQIAQKANVPLIDLNPPMAGRPEDFPDDVHPNKEGHERIAHIVYSYLTGQPLILPAGNIFTGTLNVTLTPTVPNSKIYYTTDGTEPTATSTPYTQPITLTDTTTVKALAVGDTIPVGQAASSQPFTKATALPATATANTVPGVTYNFYKSDGKTLDDPTAATPTETGSTDSFRKLPHDKEAGTGFILNGYLTFPQDGVYMLNISSYDTSVISLDGQMVVNNGGSKGLYIAKSGLIAVAAGAHKMKIIYSQATGITGLGFRWAGPGVPLQDVPDSAITQDAPK